METLSNLTGSKSHGKMISVPDLIKKYNYKTGYTATACRDENLINLNNKPREMPNINPSIVQSILKFNKQFEELLKKQRKDLMNKLAHMEYMELEAKKIKENITKPQFKNPKLEKPWEKQY